MDTTRLGETAAALMEFIDAEEDDDTELGVVMVLAEVAGRDEDGGWTGVRWRCSDEREWIQRGLLHSALDAERVTDE